MALAAGACCTEVWAPPSYTPLWVDNGGDGYLTYDGVVGADSDYLDMFFAMRGLENTVAYARVMATSSPRIDVAFNGSGQLRVTLRDSAGTLLGDWNSTADLCVSGEYLFHLAVDFSSETGPTLALSKNTLSGGLPGDWSAVAGSWATGPTAGTLDFQNSGTGSDLTFFALKDGTTILNAETSIIWVSTNVPLANSAFAVNGQLIDPTTVGSPTVLLTGPNATFNVDQGSFGGTFTKNGTNWADGA